MRSPVAEHHHANWWLGEIQSATLHATTPESDDRRRWASLAAVLLNKARQTGVLDDREVVTRKTNLSAALSHHGKPEDFHPSLRADLVVRESLDAVGMSASQAESTKWALRAEDVNVMRRLRRVRNIVAPTMHVADLVTDDELRQELAAWRDVLPQLP